MEQWLSLGLLAAGGLLAALQVFVGLVGLGLTEGLRPGARGTWNQIKVMAAGFGLAVPFLAAGAWLNAEPWAAAGKAILAAAALGAIAGFLILWLVVTDDEEKPKRGELDLLPGMINLVLVAGLGLILWVHGLR